MKDFKRVVRCCNTYQRTKSSNTKNDKLPANKDEDILWDKLCVAMKVPNVIRRKGKNKYLHLKGVTMVDLIKGQFKITKYDNKHVIKLQT